jgi:hypothetical protein
MRHLALGQEKTFGELNFLLFKECGGVAEKTKDFFLGRKE